MIAQKKLLLSKLYFQNPICFINKQENVCCLKEMSEFLEVWKLMYTLESDE